MVLSSVYVGVVDRAEHAVTVRTQLSAQRCHQAGERGVVAAAGPGQLGLLGAVCRRLREARGPRAADGHPVSTDRAGKLYRLVTDFRQRQGCPSKAAPSLAVGWLGLYPPGHPNLDHVWTEGADVGYHVHVPGADVGFAGDVTGC
jgi:hypothetical protein